MRGGEKLSWGVFRADLWEVTCQALGRGSWEVLWVHCWLREKASGGKDVKTAQAVLVLWQGCAADFVWVPVGHQCCIGGS